jgi:hypothetical protein
MREKNRVNKIQQNEVEIPTPRFTDCKSLMNFLAA